MQDTSIIRYLLFILFKHKYKILLTPLATTALVFVVISRSQSLYEASASILIKFGAEAAIDVAMSPSRQANASDRQGGISNEIEILTSQDLIEQVIATSGVGYLYPELVNSPMSTIAMVGQATLNFRQHLRIERVADSDVIRVAFSHPQPRVASEVVNLMVQLYQGKHQQAFSSPTAVTFLEHQVQRHSQLVQEVEEGLEQFKQTYGTHSLQEERTLLLQQRSDLSALQNSLQSQIEALEQKLSVMKDQRDTLPGMGSQGSALLALEHAKAKLRGLRQQERGLAKIFKDGHPALIELRSKIQVAKAALQNLQKRLGTRLSGSFQEVESGILAGEADLQALQARSLASSEQVKQLDQQLLALTQQEKELHALQRQLITHEQNYQTAVEKLEEYRLVDEMNRHKAANISVIEPATPPLHPAGARREVKMAIGLLIGAVAGFGLALISERTNQRLSTPADVERRLGLPVLAAVAGKRLQTITVAGLNIEPNRLLPEREVRSTAVQPVE